MKNIQISNKQPSLHLQKSVLILLISFLFVSNNVRSQWAQSSSGIGNNEIIYSMLLHGSTIYAGTGDSGLSRSTNGGANWTFVNGIPTNHYIWALYSSGSNIFAGTFGNGVYRSTNDGANWIQVNAGLTNFNPRGFLVHGAYIFASFWGGGIYRSSNNGTDWFPVGSGITNLNDWRIIEVGNNLFLASFGGGVYRSTNDGLNWTTVNSGLTNLNVYCFALIGSNLFAGTAAGVFTTTNSGANWSLANQGIVGSVQTILSKGSNLIAGTTSGVFRSTNNGMTWTAFNQSLSNLNVLSMVDNDTHLFAGTNGSSVYRRLLSEIIISVNVISTQVPDAFGMSQNYPNPFNPVTKFNFQLPGSENVKVTVYDQLGKEAAILVNEKLSAGSYEVEFNAANFTSGVYFYKIDAGNFTNIKKMILLK